MAVWMVKEILHEPCIECDTAAACAVARAEANGTKKETFSVMWPTGELYPDTKKPIYGLAHQATVEVG